MAFQMAQSERSSDATSNEIDQNKAKLVIQNSQSLVILSYEINVTSSLEHKSLKTMMCFSMSV